MGNLRQVFTSRDIWHMLNKKTQVNCEADQGLCLHSIDSTMPLLSKSKISSLWQSSRAIQPGLCQTWSETPKTVFSQRDSFFIRTRSVSTIPIVISTPQFCQSYADFFLVFFSTSQIFIFFLSFLFCRLSFFSYHLTTC